MDRRGDHMANEQNLWKAEDLTSEQLRDRARKGGIASAKAKKERKMIKEQLELLLSLPIKDKNLKAELKKMGVDTENVDNQMAMVIAMWQKAIKGDVSAATFIRDTLGEKPDNKVNLDMNLPVMFVGEDELDE